MMEKEEWENTGGFIKYKLFGMNPDYKYKKVIESADEGLLKKILVNLMSDMNDQIDYVNAKFTRELEDLKSSTAMTDSKSISKWVSLIKNWNESVEKKTDRIYQDCQLILKRMEIIVERKQQDYLRNLPQSVLDELMRNWDDTSSPEYYEAIRRIEERTNRQ